MIDKKKILVDKDLRPAYYDDFHCLVADCCLSCCKFKWDIHFSKKDYMKLKQQKCSPELTERMKQTLHRVRNGTSEVYGEFALKDGVCPLLQNDMCSLQIEKGFEVLPKVCRVFPRGEKYAPSGYLERSLSPACEGVLALLLDLPDGIDFRSGALPKKEQKLIKLDDSRKLFVDFQTVRAQCIDYLQDRRFSLPQRILLMGIALKELADQQMDIDRWQAAAQALPEQPGIAESLPEIGTPDMLSMFLTNCIRILLALTHHGDGIPEMQSTLLETIITETHEGSTKVTVSLEPYLEMRKRFQEGLGKDDYFMENLMVSLFFHLALPEMNSYETIWKSYVNFCNLYSIYRFVAVMSCRDGIENQKEELLRLIVLISRELIHNSKRQAKLRDDFFEHDSATLAHMAVLLSG